MVLAFFTVPLLMVIWYNIGNYFYYNLNKKNFKLSRMNVSAVHAISVILSYLIGIPGHLLIYWSTTYYIMDTLYEGVNLYSPEKNVNLYEFGIILHHIISIFIISYLPQPIIGNYIYQSFFLAEVSNLPMYLVYHLQKIGYTNNYVLKSVIFVEALAYIICRLVLCSEIAYDMFFRNDVPWSIWISSVVILIISAVWTIKLFKQLVR